MNFPVTRRRVIAGMGLLGIMLATGCDHKKPLAFKHGKDLSNEPGAPSFKLKDPQGNERTLADYQGKIPMVFFGFTQCPAICPTALSRAVKIKKLLGKDAERLQVIFITLDPERDTPQVLDAYVHAFDPGFVGLYGNLEETASTADQFEVLYQKTPVDDSYTISHTAKTYVFDAEGKIRLSLAHALTAEECAEDLTQVMQLG